VFASVVGAYASRPSEAGDAGRVNHRASARFRDDRKDVFQSKKDAHDVHVEHPAKVRKWIFRDRMDRSLDPGIVEEDIDLAGGLFRARFAPISPAAPVIRVTFPSRRLLSSIRAAFPTSEEEIVKIRSRSAPRTDRPK
jgi:hypothetical protein